MEESVRGEMDAIKDEICAEIVRIMQVYDEQEAEGYIGTPGGLEHMGVVWRLLGGWRDKLNAAK